MGEPRLLISTRTAADRLGCSPSRVRDLISAGVIPAIRLPVPETGKRHGHWRIEAASLDRLLETLGARPTRRRNDDPRVAMEVAAARATIGRLRRAGDGSP